MRYIFKTSGYCQSCPERNGRFANPTQCDAYIECVDGVPSEKLCPDGLMFSNEAAFFSYPCVYPGQTDCSTRPALQPARPTASCPHQFGYYLLGDANNCGQYLNCANGEGYVFTCPEGLAFNDVSLRCDWPDLVQTCSAEGQSSIITFNTHILTAILTYLCFTRKLQ
ncbi:hypothetical protein O3M35_000196 [Rhynocoris fuscipes]|uniref:Chitin-binding type-2 domain-containing protein n=1 Tax=Rhynocoris fuscipes TaxID=488301 RepID=A0AAW1DKP7_9HEMI